MQNTKGRSELSAKGKVTTSSISSHFLEIYLSALKSGLHKLRIVHNRNQLGSYLIRRLLLTIESSLVELFHFGRCLTVSLSFAIVIFLGGVLGVGDLVNKLLYYLKETS
uniref:Uncharacterized protein n=1 Tax=Glossina austeni TaxID=7395 RepID=A0A1A9V0U5_GLOAU